MVRKSFIGRLFGKKGSGFEQPKKKDETPGVANISTATLDRKEDRGKDQRPVNRPAQAVPPKPAPRNGGPEGLGEAIQPEILSRTERVATESREKIDVIAKKMSAQEEASVKISDGIKGLSNILSNIDQRLDEQTQQSSELVRTVKTIPEMMKDVPEASRAGIELLHSISKILESHENATKQMGQKIAGLPNALEQLSSKISHDAVERTKEKKAFHESVETMRKSIHNLESRNENLSKAQMENTRKIVDSFKDVHTMHQQQINALIKKGRNTNLLIGLMILVLIAGIVVVATTL